MKKNYYKETKERIRQMAIMWQELISRVSVSQDMLIQAQEYYEFFGRRYGLLKEFRENGII